MIFAITIPRDNNMVVALFNLFFLDNYFIEENEQGYPTALTKVGFLKLSFFYRKRDIRKGKSSAGA